MTGGRRQEQVTGFQPYVLGSFGLKAFANFFSLEETELHRKVDRRKLKKKKPGSLCLCAVSMSGRVTGSGRQKTLVALLVDLLYGKVWQLRLALLLPRSCAMGQQPKGLSSPDSRAF